MRKTIVAAPLVVLGLALGACGNTQPVTTTPAAPEPSVSPAPATTKAADAPKEDSHGLIIKNMGQIGSYGGESLENAPIKFKVNSIEPFTCKGDEYTDPTPPENGRYLEVRGTLTVGDNAPLEYVNDASMFSFGAIGPDNYKVSDTFTLGASSCLESSKTWPSDLQAGTNYTFDFLADVPKGKGLLTLTTPFNNTTHHGWGWNYS